jgi:hypothetical protein
MLNISFQIEYDLLKSNYDNMVLKNSVRIEQYAVPLSMAWYPPIHKESFLVVFNDQVISMRLKWIKNWGI